MNANLEKKLSGLASKFRSPPKDASLTKPYRDEIAAEYKKVVKELIESGTWINMPEQQDMLPEPYMPEEFFNYWNKNNSVKREEIKKSEEEEFEEKENKELNDYQQEWLDNNAKKTSRFSMLAIIHFCLIGFLGYFCFREIYSPMFEKEHIKNIVVGTKWIMAGSGFLMATCATILMLWVVILLNRKIEDLIEAGDSLEAKQLFHENKEYIVNHARMTESNSQIWFVLGYFLFFIGFLSGGCFVSGSMIFFSEIVRVCILMIMKQDAKNLVSKIITPENMEWLES